jgi:hypothetical protein
VVVRAGRTGVRPAAPTDEDHRVTENGQASAGRLLVESGEPVAGSMARSAAAVLYGEAPSRIRLAPDLASALCRVAGEVAGAALPARERMRAGAVLAFTVELAATRSAEGREARTDGFFTAEAGRSRADALAEAVVRAARGESDEWRVRHLGYLLAEVTVSPDLDPGLVGRGMALAESLSWRQLALLAGVGRRDRVPLPMAPLEDEPRAWRAWGARQDLADLQGTGLLDPPPVALRPGGSVRPRLRAADLRLTRRGVLVHRLLALDFVHEDAVTAALEDLGLPRS